MKTTELAACQVRAEQPLRDAMWTLERSALSVVLVVDPQGKLVGVMTDGDVRRAILGGATLETPIAGHMNQRFVSVRAESSRAEVVDLMRARRFGQIPVVDAGGRLVGLHLVHDMVGVRELPNWAVVMAGGEGRRLRPFTEHVPKPMLRVAGRPILERIVLHLVGAGISRIFLSVNYRAEVIEQHFEDGHRFGCRIEYLRETEPLGTAGALSLLPERPIHPILLMNGDLVTDVDVGRLVEFHTQGGQAATVGVRRYLHHVPFGCVELEGDRVRQLEEKPSLERLVNAGVYVLDAEVVARVARVPTTGPAILEGCLNSGQVVRAFEIQEDWIDVGQKDQLEQARKGT